MALLYGNDLTKKNRRRYQKWTHIISVIVAGAYIWNTFGRMRINCWYNIIWRFSKRGHEIFVTDDEW